MPPNGEQTRTEGEYKKLKVTDLKDLLKAAGLPVSGKKDELIARLLQWDAESAAAPAEPEVERAETAEEVAEDDSAPPPTAAPAAQPAAALALEPASAPVVPLPAISLLPPSSANGHHSRQEDDATENRAAKRVRVEDVEMREVAPRVQSEFAIVQEPVVEEEEPPEYNFEPEAADTRPTDMYLDTINRQALDFDFERLCSVTLSHNNIYACLTDGKYFQGRGKTSPAYAHSIAEDHHVYINLTTLKVYVLPDGYEVTDPSLDDIKYLLYPTFTPPLLSSIDASLQPSFSLSQQPYYPGFVGLNNIKSNSHLNAILQALLHVIPFRDYFILSPAASSPNATELVRRFAMLCRKVWNPKAFKGQVSPHEFLQECANRSAGRFRITEAGDPLEFLGWLLNTLHRDLGGSKKAKSSVVYSAFQGEVRVDDQQVLTTGEFGGKPRFDLDRDVKSTLTPFLFLAIDLPPPPLFQDAIEKNIIPQVPIATVLAKYDGLTTQEANGVLRRYKITRLPPFLILHMKRFTKNNFVEEKNPTIVNFPLRGVDMKDYVDPVSPLSNYYDLVANVTHSSAAGTVREETVWKSQVHLRPERDSQGQLAGGRVEDDEKWFQIQDLIVEEINRGMIALGESYIQVWEKRTPTGKVDLIVDPPKVKTNRLQ